MFGMESGATDLIDRSLAIAQSLELNMFAARILYALRNNRALKEEIKTGRYFTCQNVVLY